MGLKNAFKGTWRDIMAIKNKYPVIFWSTIIIVVVTFSILAIFYIILGILWLIRSLLKNYNSKKETKFTTIHITGDEREFEVSKPIVLKNLRQYQKILDNFQNHILNIIGDRQGDVMSFDQLVMYKDRLYELYAYLHYVLKHSTDLKLTTFVDQIMFTLDHTHYRGTKKPLYQHLSKHIKSRVINYNLGEINEKLTMINNSLKNGIHNISLLG